MNLKNKVAIVTGSSRGIGRAIAERLGQAGASVVVTYATNREKADEVVSAIIASGSRAIAMALDMRQTADVRRLFAETAKEFGQLDIFVHNAAGANIFKPTVMLSEDDYDSMFLITRGAYFALQEAAKTIADGGRIVCISTGGTAMASPAAGAYAGSKAAIEQFCMCLAKELGARQITVNTVRPGVTQTDGLSAPKEMLDQLVRMTPMGRLGKPSDVAGAVALLVSEDAAWVTGQNLGATGGIV